MKTPLGDMWRPCQAPDGRLYYFNFETEESLWEHPIDIQYKALFEKTKTRDEKRRSAEDKRKTISSAPSGLTGGGLGGGGVGSLGPIRPSSAGVSLGKLERKKPLGSALNPIGAPSSVGGLAPLAAVGALAGKKAAPLGGAAPLGAPSTLGSALSTPVGLGGAGALAPIGGGMMGGGGGKSVLAPLGSLGKIEDKPIKQTLTPTVLHESTDEEEDEDNLDEPLTKPSLISSSSTKRETSPVPLKSIHDDNGELAKAQDRIKQLEKELKEARDGGKDLEDRVAELEAALGKEKDLREKENSAKGSLDRDLEAAKEEAQDAVARTASLQEELEEARRVAEDEKRALVKKYEAQVAAEKNSKTDPNAALVSELNALKQEVADMAMASEEAAGNAVAERSRLERAHRTELTTLKAELRAAQEEIESLRNSQGADVKQQVEAAREQARKSGKLELEAALADARNKATLALEEAADERRAAVEAAKKESLESHRRELEEVRGNHARELEKLKEDLVAQLKREQDEAVTLAVADAKKEAASNLLSSEVKTAKEPVSVKRQDESGTAKKAVSIEGDLSSPSELSEAEVDLSVKREQLRATKAELKRQKKELEAARTAWKAGRVEQGLKPELENHARALNDAATALLASEHALTNYESSLNVSIGLDRRPVADPEAPAHAAVEAARAAAEAASRLEMKWRAMMQGAAPSPAAGAPGMFQRTLSAWTGQRDVARSVLTRHSRWLKDFRTEIGLFRLYSQPPPSSLSATGMWGTRPRLGGTSWSLTGRKSEELLRSARSAGSERGASEAMTAEQEMEKKLASVPEDEAVVEPPASKRLGEGKTSEGSGRTGSRQSSRESLRRRRRSRSAGRPVTTLDLEGGKQVDIYIRERAAIR